MTLKVVFRRAARAEFDAAALRYDMQRPGLGAQFVSEVDRAVDLAATYPERFSDQARRHSPCAGAPLSVLRVLPRRIGKNRDACNLSCAPGPNDLADTRITRSRRTLCQRRCCAPLIANVGVVGTRKGAPMDVEAHLLPRRPIHVSQRSAPGASTNDALRELRPDSRGRQLRGPVGLT